MIGTVYWFWLFYNSNRKSNITPTLPCWFHFPEHPKAHPHHMCYIQANFRNTNQKLCSITKQSHNYGHFYFQCEALMLFQFLLRSSLHSTNRNGVPHPVGHPKIRHSFICIPLPSGSNNPRLDQGCLEDLPSYWSFRKREGLRSTLTC